MLYFNKEKYNTAIVSGKFPNCETYVDYAEEVLLRLDPISQQITMIFEGNDDLINLMLLKRSLDDAGVKNISLFAPFLPYSTMDRTEDFRALSCKYVSEFINRLGFDSVDIWESHSSVALATLDRVKNDATVSVSIAKTAIEREGCDERNALIVFPDSGAEKRYCNSFVGYKTVTIKKMRDFQTGELLGSKIAEGEEFIEPDMTAFIVDDLCRAGWTFAKAAEALRARGVTKVILCVTHAEEKMFGGYMYESELVDKIYTTDTCCAARDDDKIIFVKTVRFYRE